MFAKNFSFKVLLMGGLGNQFFQIARAVELRDKSIGVEVIYIGTKLDWLYRLGGHTKHDNWLDVCVLVENLGLKYRRITLPELLLLGLKFLSRKLGIVSLFDEELNVRLSQKYFKKSNWDVGYFQSSRHVSLGSINKVSFGLVKLMNINEAVAEARTAFHIRGGDFKSVDRVTTNDVRIAIDEMACNLKKIFVVTNDVKFSSRIFESIDVDFEISKLSSKEDFIAIATSKNVFVSNSSFSFWAAICAKNSHNSTIYSTNSWPYKDFLETNFPIGL
tara:strand:+ start:1412 stop:2236 length:825 start_codon:yes stop_codon:yes gene_type:complete